MTAPALTAEKFCEAAEILSLSENYRVLRRFVPDPAIYIGWTGAVPDDCRTGLYIDVETTGLDTKLDKIIEFAAVPFTFDADGVVYDAGKGVSFFNDPGQPLPPRITELTGLTDEMVRGHAIDVDAVRELVGQAALVVAHHADFDRRMVERPMAFFAQKAWGCSYREVPWETLFGCRVSKLPIILEDACGQFSDAHHRALEDCHAGVAALANARAGGRTALGMLLESARQPTIRIWAEGSPFGAKDKLRERGYFWDGEKKCWYRDVAAAEQADEEMFARDIGGAKPRAAKYTAKDRYSVRMR